MTFVHLNTHSKSSMLHGSADVKKLVARARDLGQSAVALTDYSNVFEAINFYRAAQSEDIKPILGVDLYFCEDAEQLRIQKVRQVSHVILLAENDIGWQNITRLISEANSPEYFFYNPRIDFKLLEKYSEGIICLTGSSLDGVIASQLYDKLDESGEVRDAAAIFKAEGLVRRFLKIFDHDHFFLEVQNTGLREQEQINARLRGIAKKYGLRTVATNNVHYVEQHDAEAHRTLLAMNTNQYNRATYTNFDPEEYYLKSREELEACDFTKDELDATLEIAERCNVEIDLKKRRLPKYQFVPNGETSIGHLRQLASEGFIELGCDGKEYVDRLERELLDIEEMGFADYFLIVHDVMSWCERQGMLLGYGRGSAGGSLVSYCLGITKIDPLEYGLIWERFLNKGRGGLPDIDTDVSRSQRPKVLEYIRERFGENNVAQLVTLGGLQAKAILKEVFRVYGMPFDEANKITALVPAKNDEHVAISLQEAIDTVPELKAYYDQYTPWFKVALALEGCYKSTGIHAAAVVISDVPFQESSYPLARSKDGSAIFGWDMNTVDSLSLLKLDILGLTTLDDIQTTRGLVKERRGVELSRDTMPLDDATTYSMLANGFNTGVFQIEKQLGKAWSKGLEPSTIEEISDLVSVIRPGPLDSGLAKAYKEQKRSNDHTSIHELLSDVTYSTYGQPIYQEQLIFACQKLAGMSLIEADLVRKAVGKKKPEDLKKWKTVFVDGCTNNGIDILQAEEIWDKFEKFAGYSFNKSHGIGYALLAYETAYLKANYTVEFVCAKLRHAESHPNKFEQMSALIYDGKLFDIEVVPPRVSMGNKDFAIIDDTHIAFGLTALKGVGVTAVNDLSKIGRDCKTFDDILWKWKTTKNKINTAVMIALVRSGAFDDIEENRVEAQARFRLLDTLTDKEIELVSVLLPHQEGPRDWIKIVRAIASEDKAPLIKEKYGVKIPNARRRPRIREALAAYNERELFDSKPQRIAWERYYLGVSLSGSEADIYKANNTCVDIIKNGYPEMEFEIAVCIDAVREHIVGRGRSAGQPMAFVTARDQTFIMDNIVVFPQTFSRSKNLLEEGNVVKIRGKLGDRDSLIAERVERLR